MRPNRPPMLPMSPKSLQRMPCLSGSGVWFCFAAWRRAFVKVLVILPGTSCLWVLRSATAAEALRYAVEDLRTPKAFGAWLQIGDERFNSTEIERLYEALCKPE